MNQRHPGYYELEEDLVKCGYTDEAIDDIIAGRRPVGINLKKVKSYFDFSPAEKQDILTKAGIEAQKEQNKLLKKTEEKQCQHLNK